MSEAETSLQCRHGGKHPDLMRAMIDLPAPGVKPATACGVLHIAFASNTAAMRWSGPAMKHAITLRIDNDLLQTARQLAQSENRTLTNLLETVLKRHMAGVAIAPCIDHVPAARDPGNLTARPTAKPETNRKTARG